MSIIFFNTHLYLFTDLSILQFSCLHVRLSFFIQPLRFMLIYQFKCLINCYLPIFLSMHLPMYLHNYLPSIYLSTYVFISIYTYLSLYPNRSDTVKSLATISYYTVQHTDDLCSTCTLYPLYNIYHSCLRLIALLPPQISTSRRRVCCVRNLRGSGHHGFPSLPVVSISLDLLSQRTRSIKVKC